MSRVARLERVDGCRPGDRHDFSQNAPYPNDAVSASSRLLKIDRRGTCQACHDPTGTFPANSSAGPVPNPLRP